MTETVPPIPDEIEPPLPQPPPATGAPAVSGTRIETTVEQANAQALTVIGSISQYLPDPARPATFSFDSTVEVTRQRADSIKELFVADAHLIDEALDVLEKHHLLLLTGARGCGKSTMAIYLGTRLADGAKIQSTLVVGSLDPKVEIDLWKVAADKHYAKRITIFTDAFGRRNSDLLGFFARGDALRWEQFTAKLRDNKAYLIFTAEPDAITHFRQQASEGLAWRDVQPLPPELVERGLDIRLNWLERRGQFTVKHVRQVAENRKHLIDTLKTLPRIARFLDQFAGSTPDLAAALQRFSDVSFWFSNDLAADVDAWCFALTLALALAVRPESGVGWYELDRLRRAVTEQIKGGPEVFPGRRRPESSNGFDPDAGTTGQLLSDDSLLLRARAEVVREPSRLGDAARFIDRSYAATIRQTLAGHHRRVLTALIPALRNIIEKERGPGSYAVRSLAAQMIGCIGELDPFSISIPLLQHDWIGPRDRTQRPFVGRLLQGVRACGNRAYQRAAIGAVDSLTADTGDEKKNSDRLLTVISAYSIIGEQDTALAMRKLGEIATEKLAPSMADLHQIERVVERVDQHLSRTASQQVAEDLLTHRFRLGRLANRLSAQHTVILLALKQAVVYLCLTTDSIEVLGLMREWISQDGTRTATLVALLFLHGGIAEDLEAAGGNVQSLGGGERVNPLVRSLGNSAGAVEKLAAFLADVHASIHQSTSLPEGLRGDLKERYAAQLTEWVRTAKSDPIRCEALQALFDSLIHFGGDTLREDVLALLGASAFTEDETMRNFAAAVQFDNRQGR